MRVVVLGGVPRSLINFRGPLLRGMTKRGHEVIACAANADESTRNQLAQWDVAYYHVPIRRSGISPCVDLATMGCLVRLLRKLRPDVVLGYTIKPVIWGSLAARCAGVPKTFAMITGLGYAFLDEGTRRQLLLQRVVCALYWGALKRADGIFFQNPDDEAEFRQRRLMPDTTPSIQINGSGVDLERFTPQPLPSEPVFLLMARLIGDKGIREYRKAARELRRRHPQARFLLAGGKDSNPAAISEAELQQWQAEGDIEYLGQLEDVRPALAACSAYVLPSYYREGTPRTVLEAMAVGRAVITTDAPGCRETVEEGVNGYLVPSKDSMALRVAMERFISNPDLTRQMGQESLRLARERYDVHRVNRVILEAIGL